jgi:hypothetical protein
MLTTVGVAGAIPAAYPKTIGPTTFDSFGPPDGGTRRSYNGAVDQFIDTHGGSWAANGPLAALLSAGYALKMQVGATQLEANSGTTHTYRLKIGGTNTGVQAVGSFGNSNVVSGYVAPSPTNVSGTITYGDYTSAGGQTAHQGIITLSYEYTRP